jgi:hypothetical protein
MEDRKPWQFQPGHPGGPGRPKGSRHRLGEAFLKALADDFEQHGVGVIERLRIEKPEAYAKVIASLLPKEISGADGGPLLSSIVVTYRKPGDSAPEVGADVAATAVVDAIDRATDEDELAAAA